MTLIALIALAAMTLLLDTPLSAQTPEIPDVIVITGAAPEPLPEPGVVVVDREDAVQKGARTVAEAVAFVPGVFVQRRGSVFEPAIVRIRGSAAEHVLVLIDGVRVSDSRSGIVDVNAIPLQSVERIEVMSGPATALTGGGSVSGAINIVTRPNLPGRSVGPTVEPSFRGAISYGSFSTAGFAGDAEVPVNSSLVRVGVNGRRSENRYVYDRNGEITRRDNAGGWNGAALIGWQHPGASGSVSVEGRASMSNRGLPGTVEFPATSAQMRDTDASISVYHSSPGAAGWIYQSSRMVGGYRERDYRDPDYSLGSVENHSQLGWGEGSVRVARRVGGRSPVAEVSAPVEFRFEGLSDTSLGEQTRLIVAVAPRIEALPDAVLGRASVSWSVAGRGEYISDAGRPLLLSGRGHVSVAPGMHRVSAGAAGGTGYRLPNFSELFWPVSGFAAGNPLIEPERSAFVECDVRIRLPGVAKLRATVNRTDYFDLIQWLPDPTGVWKPRNTGRAEGFGAEVAADAFFDLGYSPWTVDADASAAFQRTVDRNGGPTEGKQLPYRPQTTAAVSFGIRNLRGHALSTTARIVGARPVTAQNTVWLDPYVALDVAATIPFGVPGAQITVAVTNALDRSYVDTRFLPNPGREFSVQAEIAR